MRGSRLSPPNNTQTAASPSGSPHAYAGRQAGAGDALAPFRSGAAFGLRWFTPTTEAPLCGHATLAAAHVLFAGAHMERAVDRLRRV
jgi:hypothetical protein